MTIKMQSVLLATWACGDSRDHSCLFRLLLLAFVILLYPGVTRVRIWGVLWSVHLASCFSDLW